MDSREILVALLENTSESFVENSAKTALVGKEELEKSDQVIIEVLKVAPDKLVDVLLEVAGSFVRNALSTAVSKTVQKRVGDEMLGSLKDFNGPPQ